MGAAQVELPVFALAAATSLGASWVLASRIDRLGGRLGLSEGLVGVVAALAADSPEITAAIAAFGHRQGTVGAGVVLGSNVFNLAALLGLSALIAGRIRLHRRVVLFSGAVATWVSATTVLVAFGWLSAPAGLVLVGAVLVPYVAALGMGRDRLRRLPLPEGPTDWLVRAVTEEEEELAEGQPARALRVSDLWATAVALPVVIGASVVMERAVSSLGHRYGVPDLVVGALVLAGVTSLPNAVTASYLARRDRGSAVLSTALNSNALNVAVGWLLPASVTGLVLHSGGGALAALFCLGLTVGSLALAYACRGLDRRAALVIIGTYLVFAGTVLISVGVAILWVGLGLLLGAAVPAMWSLDRSRRGAAQGPRPRPRTSASPAPAARGRGHPTLVPGWSVSRISMLGVACAAVVAGVDAALGSRVLLLGLVSVAPCCVLLTGRWRPTALAGLWAVALALALGLPDGIWATSTHAAFLGSVAVVAVTATTASWVIERRRCISP